MNDRDLQRLSSTVDYLLNRELFSRSLERLKDELARSEDTFVWTTVDLNAIPHELPAEIKSCWIFHLRRDVPSGSHYHPNSVQHMVLIDGEGTSSVGGQRGRLVPFASPEHSLAQKWLVIEQGVPHEFTPEGGDLTVVSFHTCEESELEEVECETGRSRLYEGARS